MLDAGIFDLGVDGGTAVLPVAHQPDPQQYADLIYNAVLNSNWRVLAAVFLIACIAGLKWFAPKIHGKFGIFINSSRGAAIFVLFGGVSGALATALAAGVMVTGKLIVNGLVVGFLAAGGWSTLKNLVTNGGPAAPSAVPAEPVKTEPAPVMTSGYAAVVPGSFQPAALNVPCEKCGEKMPDSTDGKIHILCPKCEAPTPVEVKKETT